MKNFKKTGAILLLSASMVCANSSLASASAPISSAQQVVVSSTPRTAASPTLETRALPVIAAPVILGCVASVGLATYQAYKGGDPVEYIAGAIIGCIPFGGAAKPAVVAFIKANKSTIAKILKGLGASALAGSLTGDSPR